MRHRAKNPKINQLMSRFAEWMERQEYSGRCKKRYNRLAVELCQHLGDLPLKDVTPLLISDFLVQSGNSFSHHSFRNSLIALRCFFRFLYFGGVVSSVVPAYIRSRAPVFKVPRFLSEKQISALIYSATNPRDRALLELLYATGCRPGPKPGPYPHRPQRSGRCRNLPASETDRLVQCHELRRLAPQAAACRRFQRAAPFLMSSCSARGSCGRLQGTQC